MYKDYYQMRVEAFGNLPLLKFFYNSKTHKRAWHYLLYGIRSQEPFLLVSGDYGVGKTTLCLALVRLFKKKGDIPFIYISTPNYGYTKILMDIARRLDVMVEEEEETSLHASIYQYFKDQEKPKGFYIIIDDANELANSTLKKLRSLANFNHNDFFPFRLIFFAHSSFTDILKSRTLVSLDQRIKRRAHLDHLDYAEVREYIFSRLYKSGAPGIPAFTEDALEKIFSYSKGIPRLINNICDSSLLLGASERLTIINAAVIAEAIRSIPVSQRETVQETGFTTLSQEERPLGFEEPVQAPRKEKGPDQLNLNLSAVGLEKIFPQEKKKPKKKKNLLKTVIILVVSAVLIFLGVLLLNHLWKEGKFALFQEEPALRESPEETLRPYQTEERKKPAHSPERLNVQEKERGLVPGKPGHQRELSTGILSAPEENAEKNAALEDIDKRRSLYPWSLHLGSYRFLEKAQETLSYYLRIGLSPYLVKVDLGSKGIWWRMYEGYYKSREEAVQAKKDYNLIDALIEKTIYANLIGTFPNKSKMITMSRRLASLGYYPYGIEVGNGQLALYVGAFSKRYEAVQYNRYLSADGIQGRVVKR